MSDLKLFKIEETITEIEGTQATVERSLQELIEKHLFTFLGIRFLATEFSTGRDHGGRMDTLGIDENNCPVIIEYKRASNANVINQGLFYLDWLVNHRGDFEMLVLNALGEESAKSVEWSAPRLICIAGDFNKYDEHAIKQMNRNIELIRYVRFGDDLLLLEQVNAVEASQTKSELPTPKRPVSQDGLGTVTYYLEKADDELTNRYEALKEFLINLGDDVQEKTLKHYIAFKRIKNFACLEIHINTRNILAYVKIDPDSVQLEENFTRDVRNVGHYGTGDLEIKIKSLSDFEKAKPLLQKSYENA